MNISHLLIGRLRELHALRHSPNIVSTMLGHCTGCSAPAPHRCGTCGAPYCSRECQVAGRTTHKFTCSAKVKVGDSSNGKGVFARMAFEVGDELHSEKPLVVFSNRLYTTGSQVLQAAAQAIHDLPENKKELVMNFTDAHSPLQPTALGIARTNAVPLGFSSASDPSAYSGIFAVTCRMNHACKPNARYIWNAQAGCEKVFAMRNSRQTKRSLCATLRNTGRAPNGGISSRVGSCSSASVMRAKIRRTRATPASLKSAS